MAPNADTQLYVRDQLEKERKASNGAYARKLVEQIVFGALAIIATAVLYTLLFKAGWHV